MATFGSLLARHLAVAGLSQRAFAVATRTPLSTVNAVIGGQRKPPKRRLAAWASALGLEGAEWDAFIVNGFLCHAPPEVLAAHLRLQMAEPGARRAAEDPLPYRLD
jgi:transcriptional regulator with XRE-family HTH domain